MILGYHRISADPAALADPYTLTPERFGAHLRWLARWGRQGRGRQSSSAAGHAPRSTLHASRSSPLCLTFDDGTLDFYTTAWPLLRAHGFGATVFVVTGRVGAQADWDGPRGAPLMDWPQLRALHAEGVAVGAHAHRHHALDRLPRAELAADLAAAYAALAREVAPPAGLAYPYGRGGRTVAQAAAEAGFAWAVTARSGRARQHHPFALRRILLTGRDGPLRLWLKLATGYATWLDWRMDVLGVRDE
jgi:peptidoglycan/xylan/chitin deacetylase (PgdA/CDA1 family)